MTASIQMGGLLRNEIAAFYLPLRQGRFFERSVIRLEVSSHVIKRKMLIEKALWVSNLVGPGIDIRG
jgi:hypothetical protein